MYTHIPVLAYCLFLFGGLAAPAGSPAVHKDERATSQQAPNATGIHAPLTTFAFSPVSLIGRKEIKTSSFPTPRATEVHDPLTTVLSMPPNRFHGGYAPIKTVHTPIPRTTIVRAQRETFLRLPLEVPRYKGPQLNHHPEAAFSHPPEDLAKREKRLQRRSGLHNWYCDHVAVVVDKIFTGPTPDGCPRSK